MATYGQMPDADGDYDEAPAPKAKKPAGKKKPAPKKKAKPKSMMPSKLKRGVTKPPASFFQARKSPFGG